MTNQEIWDLFIKYWEYTIEVDYQIVKDSDHSVIEVKLNNERIEGPNYHYFYFNDRFNKDKAWNFYAWLCDNKDKFLSVRLNRTVIYGPKDLFLLEEEFKKHDKK